MGGTETVKPRRLPGFPAALALVFEVEGGFSDDHRDPGGMTNFGITADTLARARKRDPSLPWTPATLNKDQAAAIYERDYWLANRCDLCPPGINLFLFDAAVQHAPPRPVQWLQQALHVEADGVFGPGTLAALLNADAKGRRLSVLAEMAARRTAYYMTLDALDDTYGLGWARRERRVYDLAKEWGAQA